MGLGRDPNELAKEAERLLSVGRVAEAECTAYALLAAVPDHPTGLMILGVVCMAASRWTEAELLLQRGCATHPHIVGFHGALGQLRLRLNQPAAAVEPLENCVLLDPATRDHRARLLAVYQTLAFVTFSDASKQAMLACLADDTLTHSLMHKAWLSLLRIDPEATDILALFDEASDHPTFRARLTSTPSLLQAIQGHRLLQRGLERFLAADVAIERGLTFVRRWLFEHRRDLDGLLPLVCALARYCFLSEYVFNTEEDYAELRTDTPTPVGVALYACYEPLWMHERATELSRLSAEPCYRELMRIVVEEPLEEKSLSSAIPSLSPIEDEVSRAVQSQYEENPYPRWTTVGSGATSVAAERGRGKQILVAGCGTGSDAADTALTFPAATVDAIDLSRASLAYGARKAREMGIGNLSFAQADILDVGCLKKRYDFIMAAGVLHHMRDPLAGLRALLGVLRPGGILRVMLYSRIARTAVVEARTWIQAGAFAPTLQGIRDFRGAVIARPVDDRVRVWLTRSYDFYSLSQCRDLVFHVQEHTFTLLEISDIARAFDLSVVHLDVPSPIHLAAYRDRFPGDPEATSLANWHRLEEITPSIFVGMYSLWLCRAADEALVDVSWLRGASDASGAA